MSNTVVINHIGAAGRPFLFSVAEQVVVHQTVLPNHKQDTVYNLPKMSSSSRPTVKLNGLAPVSEDSTVTAPVPDRDALKLRMLQRLRPPPFKYAWCLYHDKHSASADYEGRLTLLLENIVTIKPFWESFNQLPLTALRMKDSVHFFKRGVKPVWEDPRNISGGSWTFRVPKAQSEEFWKEALLIAVGEQFADVIQPRKSFILCSSRRFHELMIG